MTIHSTLIWNTFSVFNWLKTSNAIIVMNKEFFLHNQLNFIFGRNVSLKLKKNWQSYLLITKNKIFKLNFKLTKIIIKHYLYICPSSNNFQSTKSVIQNTTLKMLYITIYRVLNLCYSKIDEKTTHFIFLFFTKNISYFTITNKNNKK